MPLYPDSIFRLDLLMKMTKSNVIKQKSETSDDSGCALNSLVKCPVFSRFVLHLVEERKHVHYAGIVSFCRALRF